MVAEGAPGEASSLRSTIKIESKRHHPEPSFLPPRPHPHHFYPALLNMLIHQRGDPSTRWHKRRRCLLLFLKRNRTKVLLPQAYLIPLLYYPPLPLLPYPQPLPPYHHYARAEDAHQYTYCLPFPLAARLASHVPHYSLAPMLMSVRPRARRVVPLIQGIADFGVQRRLWCDESADLGAQKLL